MKNQQAAVRHFAKALLILSIPAVLVSCIQEKKVVEKPLAESPAQPADKPPEPASEDPAETSPKPKAPPAKPKPFPLFDGKSLAGWKLSEFGGDGEVRVEEGKLILGFGEPLTGITWDAAPKDSDFKLPRDNYEINLEAMRVDGSDFFCGLTFPVGKDPCSLILGGWGGGVVGLSSINMFDASENETTQFFEFEEKKWYHVRLRVTPAKIEAWIDKKQVIEVERDGKEFSVRVEVELSRPLGIASFQTTAALRNFTILSLAPAQAE